MYPSLLIVMIFDAIICTYPRAVFYRFQGLIVPALIYIAQSTLQLDFRQ
jgi:hypothetical protein